MDSGKGWGSDLPVLRKDGVACTINRLVFLLYIPGCIKSRCF